MAYPIPSWITNPPNLGAEYVAGLHAGAQVAGEQARLNLSAQEAEMRSVAAERAMEREQLRDQTHLAVQKAYHDSIVGLRQQQLAAEQEKIGLATNRAANKLSAQQQYMHEIQSGVEPSLAALHNPGMFDSAAGLGSVAREYRQSKQPPFAYREFKSDSGRTIGQTSPNRYQVLPQQTDPNAPLTAKPIYYEGTTNVVPRMVNIGGKPHVAGSLRSETSIKKDIKDLLGDRFGMALKGLKDPPPVKDKSARAAFDEDEQEYKELLKELADARAAGKAAAAGGGSAAAPAAAPAPKANFKYDRATGKLIDLSPSYDEE